MAEEKETKKGLFIINPSSGRQNFKELLEDIAGRLIIDRICSTIDVYYTEKQNDGLEKARSLKKGEYDFVVAVGGDGTLNEVIAGIVLGGSEIPVAVLSTGTVNDFATYLNLPQTVEGFCKLIEDYNVLPVDVGKVNDNYFVNVVASGVFSDIGYNVTKDKKATLGKLAYYLEGAAVIPNQLSQSHMVRFTTDKETIEEEILLFMVANSQSVGGFRDIAPLASVKDGLLDIVIIRKMDIFQVLPLMIAILQGQHVNNPAVEYIQTNEVLIENLSDHEMHVDYDGEFLPEGFPIRISLLPEAVNIIIEQKEEE